MSDKKNLADPSKAKEIIRVKRAGHDLFSWNETLRERKCSLLEQIMTPEGRDAEIKKKEADLKLKAEQPQEGGSSNVRPFTGEKCHPINFKAMTAFKVNNAHHGTCINAKTNATVGLGHTKPETRSALDKLCRISWADVRRALAQDYWQVGNAWLEVVWDEGRTEILGLHHIPAADVRIFIENELYEHYWVVNSSAGDQHFATWGDLLDFRQRRGRSFRANQNSELIHIRTSDSATRFYGMPSHLPVVAAVELVQALLHHQYDFHVNRGVPEFMLWVLGGNIDPKLWENIQTALSNHTGVGKSHKTFAAHIENAPDEVEVQVEKLAMEGTNEGEYFSKMMEALALYIVSAHQVPPSLAGILVPGKMGAANEMANALLTFQSLVVGPAQETFENALDNSLGDLELNGQLTLKPGDFEFKTLTDEISEEMKKLQPVDTMGRMRDDLSQAATEGRDLEDGLQKALQPLVMKIQEKLLGNAA